MLRRDYLLKMLQELTAALARMLHDDERTLTERQKELMALYRMLGRDAEYFRSSTTDEILAELASQGDDGYLQRIEMAAELLYADSHLFVGSHNLLTDIRRRALDLYEYLDQRSDDFSLTRTQRIEELRRSLATD